MIFFRQLMRSFLVFSIITAALLDLMVIELFRIRKTRAQWIALWCRVTLNCLQVKTYITGSIPRSGLLVANHLSYLDILVFSALTHCRFISKHEVARWPVFGLIGKLAGTIFIERRANTALASAVSAVAEALAQPDPVFLFPEGTSTNGVKILPFRSSFFAALEDTYIPVTACAITYSLPQGSVANEVCYWGDMTLVPHLWHLFSLPVIFTQVTFGQQIKPQLSRKTMALKLHQAVTELQKSSLTFKPVYI